MKAKKIKWIRIRIYITGVCFLLALCILFLRAYQLQILEASHLSSLAKKGYAGELTFATQRGTIVDRNGKELAISVEVSSKSVSDCRVALLLCGSNERSRRRRFHA
jgi:cell division protein FtsI/penicillin-binding protein 2